MTGIPVDNELGRTLGDRYVDRYKLSLFWPGLAALIVNAKGQFLIFAIYKFLTSISYIIILYADYVISGI